MNQKYKMALNEIAILGINNFTNEHVSWIMKHLQNETKNNNSNLNLLHTDGRHVIVESPINHSKIEVEIPPQSKIQEFKRAWLEVYNACLLTLYVDFKELFNKHAFSKEYNMITCHTNNKVFYLPQDTTSVGYITSLEGIVANSVVRQSNINLNVERVAARAQNIKSDVKVSVVKTPIKFDKTEVTVGMTEDFAKRFRVQKTEPVKAPEVPIPARTNNIPEVNTTNQINNQEFELESQKNEPSVFENTELYGELKGLKIPDHDKLEKDDIEKLIEENSPFVLVTCADLSKERNLFCYNAEKCLEAGLTIGAYINGKAKDSDSALKDSKKILELLRDYQIKGPVIYEINNDYMHSHDSEEDIDNIINAYNGVASILTEQGYPVLVAVENDNAILLERHIKRKNIPVVFPMVYRIVPHELKEIPKNVSTILMDPQYDNDIIRIINPDFKIEKQEVKQAA